MNNKNITLVSASKEASVNNTLINRFVHKLSDTQHIHVHNKESKSLASIYNSFLDSVQTPYLVFCHDDIVIPDMFFEDTVKMFLGRDSQYSIGGVAGTDECVIKDKNLWHMMYSQERNKKGWSGAVGHYMNDSQYIVTNFGITPKRVILLDGVLLAMNLEKIRYTGARFDENYPCKFHFYDLDFCLTANSMGLKLTTLPLFIIHKSHGLNDLNNEEWSSGNKYFIDKWKKNKI